MSVDTSVPGAGGAAPSQSVTDNDRLMAALSYVIAVIVSLIVLFSEAKNREFQRYHAIQSLGLSAVAVVYEIVVMLISCGLTALVPFLGCVTWILPLLPAIPFLYYAYQAYQGKTFEIPYLTNFMRQQKWL